MKGYRHTVLTSLGLAALAFLFSAAPAQAHVLLIVPNGGEQLEVGSQFTITWQIQIAHNLQNWDLWYSTDSDIIGPWIVIGEDLAPGSGAVASIHTYNWTIPDAVDDTVWIRVRMDNQNTDYYDTSNDPFSIVLPPESGDVGQQMVVTRQGDSVSLSWEASCSDNDTDYAIYEGKLGAFTSHRPVECSTGGSTAYGPFAPAVGDRYFLAVPRLDTHEGSYGTDSNDGQRPVSSLACAPQAVLSCP